MKVWWRNLSLLNKLQIPIQLVLLVMLVVAQLWLEKEFENKLLEDAWQRAVSSATQSFLGLNSMMLNGNIRDPNARTVYFKKMAGQDGVEEFHLARGKPVQNQFGAGMPEEQARDELDRVALESGQIQTQWLQGETPMLRVVVPFAARHEFHGVNCLQCHHVSEGAINGAVSLKISLQREYSELGKVYVTMIVGQVFLQVLLFLLVYMLIHRAIASVLSLEKTMLSIRVDNDFDKRATIESGDEVGNITRVFNEFLQHIGELRLQLADKVAVLEKYHEHTEEEQRVGSFIMARMMQMPGHLDELVQRHIRPVEHLNGDILIAAKNPGGALHILLADAIGHGLSAAINVLPLCQTFYDLTEKGFSIGYIANDLNRIANKFMPRDRFVSAALLSIHFQSQVIEVWNGGIPSLLLFNHAGQVLHRWKSGCFPLGIVTDEDFSSGFESFHYQEDCQLCLFSDGLIEVTSPQGVTFGEANLLELMGKTTYTERLPTLVAAIDEHLGGCPAHDDITFALVNMVCEVTMDKVTTSDIRPIKEELAEGDWRITFSLGAAELKYMDAVPLVMQVIAKIEAIRDHHADLYLILSELFNNALDHGLLHMDSTLKLETDGFDRYLELRDERLKELKDGKIDIEIRPVRIENKLAVKLRVVDSGEGFDFAQYQSTEISMLNPYGKGIALVRSFACQLDYSARGNEVVATYMCA